MGRPTSQIDVYNLALDQLKEAPITSIDNPKTKAEAFFARYGDHVRRSALRMHAWNFATKRILLPANADAPEFEYSQSFNLPIDFVRLNSVGEFGEIKEYQLEDSKILTMGQASPLPVKYIYDFKNVARMDALFIEVWSLMLAIKGAYPLTGSSERARALKLELSEIASQAFAVDGQERPPDRIESSKYRRAHQMGTGRGRRDSRYIDERD